MRPHLCRRENPLFAPALQSLWLWVLVGLFFAGKALAQDGIEGGSIAGSVTDSWDGTGVPQVVVTVRGTTLGTTTDPAGRYRLEGVPPGDHILVFSKSGYSRATISEVKVAPGITTPANARLTPEYYEMETFEVVAEPGFEQNIELLADRQSAASLTDAIGSDMFSGLAVGDAAGALSKVTGATVADGKYAVVRGLADRYTFTTLNGMELPSADPDRKAFQLDLMPSKFIDQLNVYKTFTPDMSGGFSGGSIDIVTRSYPEAFLFEYRVSTAYNTQSSLRDDFPSSDRGSTDWLGFDDGTRAMSDELEAASPVGGSQNFPEDVKRSFNSSQFAPVPMDAPLDAGTELLLGDTRTVFGKRLGYLAGLNYKNEYRYFDKTVRTYEANGLVTFADKDVTEGVIEYQWGALVNLSLELSEDHDLSFNFLRVQSAEDYAGRAAGSHGDLTSPGDGSFMDLSVLNWTERSLAYYQLAGDHRFPGLRDVQFDWGAAVSTTTQEDPDFRAFQFRADPSNNNFNPNLTASQPTQPSRYWRELEENNLSARGDVTIPVPSYNEGENALKTGVALNVSERDYFQRGIRALGTGAHPFHGVGDPNLWMAPRNLAFINVRNFPVNLTYEGEQEIRAAYLMADWAAFDWLQLVGGARLESSRIAVDTFNLTQNFAPPSSNLEQDDWLPSLSAKIQIRDNVDLRAAWSRTVVRPTYREIAPVVIYDVFRSRTVQGNPNLEMSATENFDLRASWYPRPGELLSAGVFAKRIGRPIEIAAQDTASSRITYVNSGRAEVYGVEVESRIKLDRFWEPLADFALDINGAYIESEVPLSNIERLNRQSYGEFGATRPLYDQPAYILNANLTWEYERTGTTVTLSGGVVGESLSLVGLNKPDEFVQPAPELNLFIRQRLGENWDVRFTARNLLNPEYEVTQDWPVAGGRVVESYTKGITFGLSVGCEF
ncbi:MAG TPA: TonB-dependent receptor [Methylomirabilota bacterium]|nr:TonB-dependent receptor [Methylomirabilota bacterium]